MRLTDDEIEDVLDRRRMVRARSGTP